MDSDEILKDLEERLMKAVHSLSLLASQRDGEAGLRIHHKTEGVRLALDYLRSYKTS